MLTAPQRLPPKRRRYEVNYLFEMAKTPHTIEISFIVPAKPKKRHLDRSRAASSRGAVERPPYFVSALVVAGSQFT